MQFLDKSGKEIKSGMKLLMDDGSIEMVYDTVDRYGNSDLGINASNEAFLERHPDWERESIIHCQCLDSQTLRYALPSRNYVTNLIFLLRK